ncbi:MAG TPA: Gfo/Idh/MocA family oxidoreductase [Phycisphaerae bacterium]|nr:Gfo/Idh/MocA family oxidoreductase [Phycisphaerae bacterium]
MANSGVSTQSLALERKIEHHGEKLRLAIVGLGGISETQIRALQAMPDVHIIAGVDSSPDRLEAIKNKYNIAGLYTDYRRMLREVKPDAVSICTPNRLHAPMTVAALRAGAHVITEKPMAMNPRECQAMINAAHKARRKLMVGFQYRFHPATQMLRRARDEGAFGKILFVRCQALRRRGIPNWGVFGQKELQGGGPMIDIGVHVIEMAHYLMGSPQPVAASGNTWTYLGNHPGKTACMWPNWDYKTYNVEDLATGQIRFADGAIMHIEASFAAHIERDIWNFTLAGDKGGCSWDPPAIFTDQAGTMVNSTPAYLPSGSFDELFAAKLRNFVDACLYEKPLEAPGESGLAVQKIVDGIYRAAQKGREVTIR